MSSGKEESGIAQVEEAMDKILEEKFNVNVKLSFLPYSSYADQISLMLSSGEGVDLLPSNIELSGLEVRLINAISRERVLTTCINEVKKNYDYVLIDCMPSLGMLTINALAAADSVVIPTQPHYLSAKGLELLLRSVSKVRRQINPHLRIDGILMTMVMPRTNISKEVTALVRLSLIHI